MTSLEKKSKETGTPARTAVSPDQTKARNEARREVDEKGRKPSAKDQSAGAPVAVVGIGTSAGGLKAMEGFFDHLPLDSGMAYVVIQHLTPPQGELSWVAAPGPYFPDHSHCRRRHEGGVRHGLSQTAAK